MMTESLLFAIDPACVDWFLDSDIKPGNDGCLLQCASYKVSMKTFHCTSECKELCEKGISRETLDKYTYVDALTEKEKNLISMFPRIALYGYMSQREAIKSTRRIFGYNGRNDETDAYRHFVWSSFLVNSVGEKMARRLLMAHESTPLQAEKEKKMDLYNNKQGLSAAKEFKGKQDFNSEIEKEALERLRKNELKVIKYKFKKIPDWKGK